jgi:DNA-binding transcriptional regulator YhcF (GntR family)
MKYNTVIDYITKRIEDGTYTKGAKLPSIRHLAKELDFNKATIIKAYEALEKNI